MSKSSIEWTEVTWNPVTGCNKVSAGCKYCYAERMAKRLQAMGVEQYRNGFDLTLAPQVLDHPYKWRGQKIVFVNSMSDLFHEKVPQVYIQKVFEVMNNTPHIYQVLTKRPERLKQFASKLRWTNNIWMGVSVEQEKVSWRINDLIETPAKIKFLSLEPLIGPIDNLYIEAIDWVIVGGESGPGARPMKKAWAESIADRCKDQGVPFFFKQWGKKEFNENPEDPTLNKNHPAYAKGGCQLNGQIIRQMPGGSKSLYLA